MARLACFGLALVVITLIASKGAWYGWVTVRRQGFDSQQCVFGPWSPWTPTCPKCHDNFTNTKNVQSIRTRSRPVLAGKACSHTREVIRCPPCGAQALRPTCELGPWSSWGACRAPCGFGNRVRTRTVVPIRGGICIPGAIETMQMQPCPGPRPKCSHHEFDTTGQNQEIKVTSSMNREPDPETAMIGCRNFNLVNITDAEPFGRGLTKEVWRGTLRGQRVVVKLPADADAVARFRQSITWEMAWLKRYAQRPQFVNFLGFCAERDAAKTFEIVEGGLTKWEFVANSSVTPWCFRIDLAIQVARIVALLDQQDLIHCDWKYDQLAIAPDGTVKVVDVKSIRWLLTNRRPYKSDRKCGIKTTKQNTTKYRGCRTCFKTLSMPYEHTCMESSGFCPGFDSRSLVSASAQSIFQPLLIDYLTDPPDDNFKADVLALIKGATQIRPKSRSGVVDILTALLKIDQQFFGPQCRARIDTKKLVASAYREMLSTRVERCAKRYC